MSFQSSISCFLLQMFTITWMKVKWLCRNRFSAPSSSNKRTRYKIMRALSHNILSIELSSRLFDITRLKCWQSKSLPIFKTSRLLHDQTFKMAISLHLAMKMCFQMKFRCDNQADEFNQQPPFCKTNFQAPVFKRSSQTHPHWRKDFEPVRSRRCRLNVSRWYFLFLIQKTLLFSP